MSARNSVTGELGTRGNVRMTCLLTTAVCWFAAASALFAQVARKQEPDGSVSLTMRWNVEWNDENGVPYHNQPVEALRINLADLTKKDIEEIAAFPTLSSLVLG